MSSLALEPYLAVLGFFVTFFSSAYMARARSLLSSASLRVRASL
jgi:hypothetical protein